eukprot:3783210-Pleurochrysis_carterae.AAC.1
MDRYGGKLYRCSEWGTKNRPLFVPSFGFVPRFLPFHCPVDGQPRPISSHTYCGHFPTLVGTSVGCPLFGVNLCPPSAVLSFRYFVPYSAARPKSTNDISFEETRLLNEACLINTCSKIEPIKSPIDLIAPASVD